MKDSAIHYILLGAIVFAAFFGIQAMVVSHYFPVPDTEDFNHPLEVTGTYKYYKASRGASTVWVNNTPFYCGAGAISFYTCLRYTERLPQRAVITVQIVNIKMIYGDIAMAMNIKSSGAELFIQTPAQCINAWRNENIYWFSSLSLIIAIFVVGCTRIILTRNRMTT
ncbi:hypothetical protein ISP15_16590 [Dyella jejuensis]|uniref:Uncharacterized protein n=1 Tax=Dyella jejuensis TaxID=1432009 RepID=A0ABW8JNC8_9GAMM